MSGSFIQRLAIRLWLATASIVTFVLGWAVLAHAPKPSQTAPSAPAAALAAPQLAPLAPVPTLDPALLMPQTSQLLMPSAPFRGQFFSTGGS